MTMRSHYRELLETVRLGDIARPTIEDPLFAHAGEHLLVPLRELMDRDQPDLSTPRLFRADFYSDDTGTTWRAMPTGVLFMERVLEAALDETDSGELFFDFEVFESG